MSDLRIVGFAEVRARLTGNRLAVYEALAKRGPSTGSEIARAMGWTVLSVRPRVVELVDMSHAIATGRRRDSEHEFKALSASEAAELHAQSRAIDSAPTRDAAGNLRGTGVFIPAPVPGVQVQAGFSFA